MEHVMEVIKTLSSMPTEGLLAVLALAIVALAAFAIHAIASVAKDRRS